jgi:hypothetical protein
MSEETPSEALPECGRPGPPNGWLCREPAGHEGHCVWRPSDAELARPIQSAWTALRIDGRFDSPRLEEIDRPRLEEKCPECGAAVTACSEQSIARGLAESYFREQGLRGIEARQKARAEYPDLRKIVTARPDAGEAVAWAYERDGNVRINWGERSEDMSPAWTETPLYAYPPAAVVNESQCGTCGARYPTAPAGTLHKCGRCEDGVCRPIGHPPAAVAGEGDALEAYRAAVRWIAADSWDGCSECIRILRMARSLDDVDWTPDQHAAALKRLYERAGQAPLSQPAADALGAVTSIDDAMRKATLAGLEHRYYLAADALGTGHGITNIKARADMIAHDTIPEDGKYRSNTQYRRLWRVARDAALSAFEYAALQASSAGEADA